MDLVYNVFTVTLYHSNHMKLMRKSNRKILHKNTWTKLNNPKNTWKYFRFFSECGCISFENCSCSKVRKFPIPEKKLTDLRNAGKIVKGSVAIKNTKTLHHRKLIKSNLKKLV